MRAVLEPDFAGFEWDDNKRQINLLKHAIEFEEAAEALSRPHATKESFAVGDGRTLAVCLSSSRLIAVVFTMRGEKCRIISARAARKNEQREYRFLFAE